MGNPLAGKGLGERENGVVGILLNSVQLANNTFAAPAVSSAPRIRTIMLFTHFINNDQVRFGQHFSCHEYDH